MKKHLIVLLAAVLLLSSCSSKKEQKESATGAVSETVPAESEREESEAPETSAPAEAKESSEDIAASFIDAWMDGDVSECYGHLSSDVVSLLDETEFADNFNNITDTFGNITGYEKTKKSSDSGYEVFVYRATAENADVFLKVYVKNKMISGINQDVRFTKTVEKKVKDGVTERYFLLKSGEYELNAVYTFTENDSAPAVLLIPGSGPSDYNATYGILEPFRDIALGLAEHGINSLRLEKRTTRYGDELPEDAGVNEEYFDDFTAALEWLKAQKETKSIYLLGHSLGGQIAPIMAERCEVSGIIIFNSTPRHLADIAADQYSELDGSNDALYRKTADAVKTLSDANCVGQYYYGATDYYWASYNELDVEGSIERATVPILIINSHFDKKIFDTDIDIWKLDYSGMENVKLVVYGDVSHCGYEIDESDTSALYDKADFSEKVIEEFASFCK